jgi:hypothetical protein
MSMIDPIVLTRHAVQESPTLRDLYLRRQRAQKVSEQAIGPDRAPARFAVELLTRQIAEFLGGRDLAIVEEED